MRKYFKSIIIGSLWFLFSFNSYSQSVKPSPSGSPIAVPKLVVGIVIDQMRYDYVYKYWNKYGNDGFKRLVNEGFFCKNTHYNYMPTYTGPGHASIYTGAAPSVHGIVANDWYDRVSQKNVYCSSDNKESAVGSTSQAGNMSPRNMLSTSVGDELKLATNKKSKVIGIALKDRGAILPAGHVANAAYWFDGSNGSWISSTFYMKELPKWVSDFNKKELPKQYLSKPWNTSLPIDQYTESLADDNPYEEPFEKDTKPVFPYDLPALMQKQGLGLIRKTPYGNSFTKDFAIETIRSENLGKNGNSDFIAISFSSSDYIGHQFGPQSVEVEDCYIKLDKDIAELLTFLDGWLGKNNVLLFLTSDHGAMDAPSYLMDNKVPAGYIYDNFIADTLKKFLAKNFGDTLVLKYNNQQIYLDKNAIEKKKIDEEKMYKSITGFLTGFPGVSSCYETEKLMFTDEADLIKRNYKNGIYSKRSGNMVVNYDPSWVDYGRTGTTHGSPYSYDTHVPLLWYGHTIKSGSSVGLVNITDIAPTLSMFLNISYPNGCVGNPIEELFGK